MSRDANLNNAIRLLSTRIAEPKAMKMGDVILVLG